jgi:hypothetical protein
LSNLDHTEAATIRHTVEHLERQLKQLERQLIPAQAAGNARKLAVEMQIEATKARLTELRKIRVQ